MSIGAFSVEVLQLVHLTLIPQRVTLTLSTANLEAMQLG